MKIFIGADKISLDVKNKIILFIRDKFNHEIIDIEFPEIIDYPEIALKICQLVIKSTNSKGILICGTGMGMSVAANKIFGIRATLCNCVYSAIKSRTSNDANVLTLGSLTTGEENIKNIVETWLKDYTVNKKSVKKIDDIKKIENSYFKKVK